MAKGTINKVILIGRVGVDPEIRYMPNGGSVITLSIATNDGYKDKSTGKFIDHTEWHRVSAFGQLAETLGNYVKKGQLLYVEGRLQTNKWQDRNGNDRYSTDIITNQTQMIGGNFNTQQIQTSKENIKSESLEEFNKEDEPGEDEMKEKNVNVSSKTETHDFDDEDLPF